MADNTGSDHVVTQMPEDEPALQAQLFMPDSKDDTVEQSLNQDGLNMDADQTIHTLVEESDRPIEDTNGPVNEEDTNRDATNVEHGETPGDKKKLLRCTWKMLKTVLYLLIVLLVLGGLGAVFYFLVHHKKAILLVWQQKMKEIFTKRGF